MSNEALPAEAGPGPSHPEPFLTRMTGWVAITGGLLAVAVAILVTLSVFGRWLFSAPIDGDFEFVKMATAVAVFAYLPYTQIRRANIVVDTFTAPLGPRLCRMLDAFWDLAYAGFAGFMAYALVIGTMDAVRSGETTMQRQIPLWPSIGLAMLLCFLLAITALVTALALRHARQHGAGQ